MGGRMSAMTITEFLLARIAADEASAKAVLAIYEPDEWGSPLAGGNHFPAEVTLWDRFDPARVLAECAAKRVLLGNANYIAINALAAVYADHPDYKQKWGTVIPEAAVEAAVEAHCEGTMLAALEAVYPILAAQALREAVDAFPLETISAPDTAVAWLMRRAEQLRSQA